MNRIIHNLLAEPRGQTYQGLLRYALEYCDRFEVVIRSSVPIANTVAQFIRVANPFLLKQEDKDEWFGTQLFGQTALVHTFRFCPETMELLVQSSDALFSWLQPDLPEDLCLIRLDTTPLLVTISHERDGYLLMSAEEAEALIQRVRDLVIEPSVQAG
jgi:hypothetical protein